MFDGVLSNRVRGPFPVVLTNDLQLSPQKQVAAISVTRSGLSSNWGFLLQARGPFTHFKIEDAYWGG